MQEFICALLLLLLLVDHMMVADYQLNKRLHPRVAMETASLSPALYKGNRHAVLGREEGGVLIICRYKTETHFLFLEHVVCRIQMNILPFHHSSGFSAVSSGHRISKKDMAAALEKVWKRMTKIMTGLLCLFVCL